MIYTLTLTLSHDQDRFEAVTVHQGRGRELAGAIASLYRALGARVAVTTHDETEPIRKRQWWAYWGRDD